MPALLPPSMQIGALPQGFSSTVPVGPTPAAGMAGTLNAPRVIQQAASASTVAAPASFTTAAFTASQVGSTLVAIVALACSGAPAITGPAGWTLLSGSAVVNAGNTLAVRIYALANNVGAITTAAFTAMSNINGIAVGIYELANMWPSLNVIAAGATANNSSTTPSNTQQAAALGGIAVGCEADVTGQAFTNSSSAAFVAGTTATSTTGATVVIIRPFVAVAGQGGPLTLSGTLAGALANGVTLAILGALVQGQIAGGVAPVQVDQGAGYSATGTGYSGWGIGGTKPGGAGGGQ